MPAQLGVGIVGVGVLGRRHAENLARHIPASRLVAVADASEAAARSVADDLGARHWTTSTDELVAYPDVEAVVIASSDAAHGAGIVAAARAEKPVFCEKPITTTLAEADTALAAVATAGVALQIGFMRRYDPAYLAARQHIAAGRIGTPILFKAMHRNHSLPSALAPKPGDGNEPNMAAFTGSAIHDYDNARWLMHDEVERVHAVATRISTSDDIVDSTLTTLHFQAGAIGNIDTIGAARYAYDVRTEVVGTHGTVFIGSLNQTPCLLATGDGITHDAPTHWLQRFGDTYLIQLQDWVSRTLAGDPPTVTGEDGRAALAIAIAAVDSFRQGRTVSLF